MIINKNNAIATVFYTILLLIIPATFTLLSVIDANKLIMTSTNPSPLGYSISLALFVLPVSVLGLWFFRHPDIGGIPKTAVKLTLLILIPAGIVLDILFGSTYFNFANEAATLGIQVPVLGGTVPIEEFVFYIFGFTLVLFLYVWCDEYWLRAYNEADYTTATRNIVRIIQFHPYSLLIGAMLLLAAIGYKNIFAVNNQGFPWYFTYLIFAAIIPAVGLYPTVKTFVNWRAVSFTCTTMLLISLMWEVTLALPYGWWGYNSDAMMGIYIKPWNNLPLEAVVVWLTVSFTSIFIYEAIKIWRYSNKPFKQIMYGKNILQAKTGNLD